MSRPDDGAPDRARRDRVQRIIVLVGVVVGGFGFLAFVLRRARDAQYHPEQVGRDDQVPVLRRPRHLSFDRAMIVVTAVATVLILLQAHWPPDFSPPKAAPSAAAQPPPTPQAGSLAPPNQAEIRNAEKYASRSLHSLQTVAASWPVLQPPATKTPLTGSLQPLD